MIPTLEQFSGLLGTTLTVSGTPYTWISAIGEAIPPIQPGVVMTISGPQGPQGPAGPSGGSISVYSVLQTENFGSITAGSSQSLCSLALPSAGTYLILVNAVLGTPNISGGQARLRLYNTTEGGNLAISYYSMAGYQGLLCSFQVVAVIDEPVTIELLVEPQVNDASATATDPSGEGQLDVGITALQIATA